jgi:alkylation response protein AidB-like acyl-CoA dehydrogenase
MTPYRAPLQDIRFVLTELAGLEAVQALPGCEEATAETVEAVLAENAKFVEEVVAPLNRRGDEQASRLSDGVVTVTPGFKDAFHAFTQAGWQGVQHPTEYGGQGLPKLVAAPCIEMLNAANLSFALCPLLTDGAIEALMTAGTQAQRDAFIPHFIAGRWTGTMNLTEPQAGSDLALVRTKAVPQAGGSYRVTGTKIFITFGEHDMAENIVHLVLARTPGAPEGVKGISLFIVPKFLVKEDGSLGARNDVWCQSIEHKLGIKASPTAVLLYGDGKGEVGAGAIGYLIGEENRGLEYMFIMMNAARYAVGVQGIALADRAYQQAAAYARERVQSRDVAGSAGPVAIVNHPDVRRLLMRMRALTEAARAVAYVSAAAHDAAHHHPDAAERQRNQAFYEYMVPIVKGWSTELSVEVASLGVQVHGGMGFIEETGAAQFYRDARILPIYEGTTAIQANDLIGRKTARDGGATARAIVAAMRKTLEQLAAQPDSQLAAIRVRLDAAVQAYEDVIGFVAEHFKSDMKAVFAGSVPYLMLAGTVHGGWQMARAALAAQARIQAGQGEDFHAAKVVTARFYADHVLTQAAGLRDSILDGADGVFGLSAEQF